MKALFTAEAISKGGRSGAVHSPNQLLNVTLENPLKKAAEKLGPNPELLFAGAYSARFNGQCGQEARHTDQGFRRAGASQPDRERPGRYRLAVELHSQLPGIDRAQAQSIMDEAHKTCLYSKALRGDTTVRLLVD
jgi:Ohr subfamily peroxiredoxin